MNILEQIDNYINSQPQAKATEILQLHQHFIKLLPGYKLWFDDGKNSENKTVSNPTIGYGEQTIKYADGKTKAFFQVGLSGNATGISVYILGIKDKTYLAKTFGEKIGKAKVTGYCIRFKHLKEINLDVLSQAVLAGVEASKQE